MKAAFTLTIEMSKAMTRIQALTYQGMTYPFTDERGASMVEYALLVVLIAIIALVAVAYAGNELSETYSEIDSGLEWAGSR